MLRRCCAAVSSNYGHIATVHVPGMCYVALACLQLDLVYLAAADECQQAASSHICIAPMRQSKLNIVCRLERKGMTCPRKKRLALRNEPVFPAVELDCDDGGDGRLCRD
jgi:hypothetical protein